MSGRYYSPGYDHQPCLEVKEQHKNGTSVALTGPDGFMCCFVSYFSTSMSTAGLNETSLSNPSCGHADIHDLDPICV